MASIGHTGSWGLPDLGITEFFSGGLTSQGGSNLLPGGAPTTQIKTSGGVIPVGTSSNNAGFTNNLPQTPINNSQAIPTAQQTVANNPSNKPAAPADSKFTELQKIGSDRNPVQEAEYQQLLSQLNAGQNDINRQIDEAYGATDNYLNQAEQSLRSDQPNILGDINAQFGLAGKQIEQNRDQTFGTLDSQQMQADTRKQNVLADARRLYDELRRGYAQRFGGASSAGQAATELSNLEQQRQQGRTLQQYNEFANQLASKRVEVERDYQFKTEKLAADKTAAVNEANREFQNKLLQIAQSKAQNSQLKAQANISALQDLRNKIYQISLAELQYKQALQLQYAQNNQIINTYANNNANSIANSQNALLQALSSAGFSTPQSNLQVSNTSTNAPANPYVGALSRKDDELIGSITPTYKNEYQSLLA